MKNFDADKQMYQLEMQSRNRILMWNRIKHGLQAVLHKPWILVFPFLLILLALISHHSLGKMLPSTSFAGLAFLLRSSLAIIIFLLTGLLMCGFLMLLGTPNKAKKVDSSLVHIGLVDCYGFGPILVANQKIQGSSARKMTFYSKGISKETWERNTSALEDILTYHLIEPITYGKNSNYIVLTVALGIRGHRSEPLYDDEL